MQPSEADEHKGSRRGSRDASVPLRVQTVGAGATGPPCGRSWSPCQRLPDHVPAPNIADRVGNQALMRIFRVSPGPAPRPPGCCFWEREGKAGPCT